MEKKKKGGGGGGGHVGNGGREGSMGLGVALGSGKGDILMASWITKTARYAHASLRSQRAFLFEKK